MPEWITLTLSLIAGALILRLTMTWMARTPPAPWQDPNRPEAERNEDFWDRQW